MKNYIGNCIKNPFKSEQKIFDIVNNANEISQNDFVIGCNIGNTMYNEMKNNPDYFKYYKSKDGKIYFFTHSAIEYFYK